MITKTQQRDANSHSNAPPIPLQRVRELAQEDPERTAISFCAIGTSYLQLHTRSSAVANGLLAQQLPKSSRIAILDFNDVSFAEIFLGTQKTGHVLTPINARLAAPEVAWIVNDAQAPILFVGRDHYAQIEEVESTLCAKTIIALHGEHARWPSYTEWRDSQSTVDPNLPIVLDDDMVQLYTSGTTGHPKGVCHTYRTWNAAAHAASVSSPTAFQPDCIYLTCLPLFHVAGINPLCFVLSGGGKIVLTRRTDPVEILSLLENEGITNIVLVPALILAVVNVFQAKKQANPSLPKPKISLRILGYGASPIAEDVLQRAREIIECPFEHLYGMTENWGVTTVLPANMHDASLGKLKSCGRPQMNCEIKVVDETGVERPAGEVGEIAMRSPWIMRGYWRRDDATASAIRDGWLFTGDAGYVDSDGYLYIHDRMNDMIKPGSENVYPAEVENALFSHPSVADAAVIGVPDERWGEAVKAVLVLKPNATLDTADIERHLRTRIAGFKIPRSYAVVAALPRNASGKVLRRQLREQK